MDLASKILITLFALSGIGMVICLLFSIWSFK